jgi:hypothetical protein
MRRRRRPIRWLPPRKRVRRVPENDEGGGGGPIDWEEC